jgi:two-component SAPR family response regulator
MKILMISVDDSLVRYVSSSIEYSINRAIDCVSAISLVGQTDFDVIFVDGALPYVSTTTLIEKLYKVKSDLKIITLCTKYNTLTLPEDKNCDKLFKPVDKELLVQMVAC